jgi:hypothetical protein
VKFFFPDSQDLVDPGFDFEKERWSDARVRQRDDLYAHEIFQKRAFDGLLVSKGIVDGFGGVGSRYSIGQRNRLLRNGVREFFRLERAPYELPVMGDCGAFTYVREKRPPYTADQVIQFYAECQFDFGLSVDHVIFEFKTRWDVDKASVPPEIRERQAITLQLAMEFFDRHHKSRPKFSPVGVAQGWSPQSYAIAVKALQDMGYRYVALGGMVPLKTPEILASLEAIAGVRKPSTKLHLLGVTRTEAIPRFASYGVASFDSTSPLRQAFKDDRDNYYTLDSAYTAVRIPQVEGNPTLQKLVLSGVVDQGLARRLEKACLSAMRDFEAGKRKVDDVVGLLLEYEELARPHRSKSPVSKRRQTSDNESAYREVLEAAPWRRCPCEVCRNLGHHVILFRGAERNRRRGFHNLYVFYRRLQRELGRPAEAAA